MMNTEPTTGFPAGPANPSAVAAETATLAALHGRLAAAAASLALLDIAYRVLDTAVGPLLLAATERGLLRVAFGVEDHDLVLGFLAEKVSPRILHAPARLDAAARELDEYLEGKRTAFDLPLDHALSCGYRLEVQEYLPSIGYGHTASYGQIAAATGRPRAVRAVGTACATNPLPLVVPCHRVLRSDGTVGGYLGGSQTKAALLSLERKHLDRADRNESYSTR